MAQEQVTTLTGLAVTLVALSRFLAIKDPTLADYLRSCLAGAESAGVKSADLELLRTIVKAVAPTPTSTLS